MMHSQPLSTFSDKKDEHLPLPPVPGGWKMLQYLLLSLPTYGVENVTNKLLAEYGPIVRLEMKLPKPLIWLFETCTRVNLRPYILLSGSEANKLVTMSHPDLVQRAPTVAKNFPAPDGTLQAQPSIASIDGEAQKQQRRLVMQAFKQQNLSAYIPHMHRIIEHRIASWQGKVDIFEELTQLTLAVLARTMLGIEPYTPLYEEFISYYWPFTLRQKQGTLLQTKDKLWQCMKKIVTERRRQPGDDALSALIMASDTKNDTKISEEDLLNYAQMLMEFGHSDVTISMTYLTALLATHQDWKQYVLDEQPNYSFESIVAFEHQFPQTMQIIREVERLYPAVTFILRYANADLTCGGYHIPKDSWLVSLIQQTHLSQAEFSNPCTFDPKRFAEPALEHKKNYALMGFGAGYHSCIAKNFTYIQEIVYIHTLLRMKQIRLLGQQEIPKINYRGAVQRPGRKLYIEVS